MILLDTCALLWWTLDPEQLSKRANEACLAIPETGAVISSISVWEIGIKMKKGKLSIPVTLQEYVSRLRSVNNFHIIPVDENVWIRNINLEWDNRDPADRCIIATAELHNLPIVTKDNLISAFYTDVIW